MLENETGWSVLIREIEKAKALCPREPLAICASPKTVELLKNKAKALTTAELTGAATICGIDIFAFEEIPKGRIVIQPREWVMQMLKHRVAWLEWLRHG